MASVLLLSACGDKAEEVPLSDLVPDETVSPVSDLTYADVDWEGWTPVYGEMRAADEEAVAEIRQRVADLNTSSWTVHESLTDTELAYTPEHVRGSWDRLDLHVDPREDWYDAVVTACTEDGCSELDRSDDVDTDAEALAGTVAGPYAILRMQLGLPDEVGEALDEGPAAISTVDSPAGPWECLVVAEHRRDLEALVGSPVTFDDYGPGHSFVAWCVDARGLVLKESSESSPVLLYDAWRPGVDEDAIELLPAAEVSEAPVDPAGDYEDALWATWHGVYEDVRPATRDDLTRLRDRTAVLNETSWTGVLDGYGATMSVSPEHVRVDMGFSEWHFDSTEGPFDTPYVLCVREEKVCIRVGKDADPGDSPHVFNNDLDSMTFTWLVALLAQRDAGAEDVSHDQTLLAAVVDSPVGPLDCLVSGDDPADLEGAAVGEEDGTDEAAAPVCVDQRGLVQQVSDGGLFGMRMPYVSWHQGVDDGFDAYPFPVRDYGEE